MKLFRIFSVFITVFFQYSPICHSQLDDFLKKGGKLLDKSPTKLIEKYFSNAPISTSFDDAKWEVMLLGDFDPDELAFMHLSTLPQNEKGDYLVTEGLYSARNKSFCLKAGTYGPHRGDGHLYASLLGPKSELIKKLLVNWQSKAQEIPQQDVQCLIWAIIARTDIDKMQPKYHLTLARLLDKEDIIKLSANSLKDKALETGMEKLKNEIPPEVYMVFQAERNLRNMYSKADATYEQFENMAVLAGMAPPSHLIRDVSKARWSYHPNGYFIRMTPQGYSSTTVDVYVPMAVSAETDASGRIISVSHLNKKLLEFNYEQAASIGGLLSSAVSEVKFSLPGIHKSVKLQGVKPLDHVKKDFSFSGRNDNQTMSQFTKLLNTENKFLTVRLQQNDQAYLFNLYNAISFFNNYSGYHLDAGSLSLIKYLLNESYNYTVYKNITTTANKQAFENLNPGHDWWVIVNQSAAQSGPAQSMQSTYSGEKLYNLDPGTLDLSDGVATPANRSAQRIGQSKPPKDKPWYEDLPPCPCTYKEAQDSAKRKGSGWSDCGPANQTYHYGAVNEVRWTPDKVGKPGQQCTYDAKGNLITSGIAAGSPDKTSPQGCGTKGMGLNTALSFPGHLIKDMITFSSLPCWQYLKEWPANNANNCPKNPVSDISNMKKTLGDMTCPEVTKLFEEAAKSKTISDKLKNYLLGNGDDLTPTELIQEFNKWAAKEGCPGKPVCNTIHQAKQNLHKVL